MTAVHLVTTAGSEDGRGHLSRMLAMAEALAGSGARLSIEILRGAPTLAEAARLRALGVTSGPAGDDVVALVDLPDPNEVTGRWPADRLAAFDDREWLRGATAIVIQPSLARWSGSAEAGRVLEGYAFAPIRAGLRRLAAAPPPESVPPTVVVCFGGSDPADVSARVVPAIAAAGSSPTVAILGPGYRGSLGKGGGDRDAPPGLAVLRDPPDLDERLATARVVVIGGGTMKFELALLGRPAILLAVADDQLPVGPPFAATGAARDLGDGRTIEPAVVADAVATLMEDDTARAAMASRGPEVVDGRGAERIAEAILELAAGSSR